MASRSVIFRNVFFCVWLCAVVLGFAWLLEYAGTAGRAGEAPRFWPASSRISRQDGLPTLVMFAHPRCPCTRASMNELARVLTGFRSRVKAVVVFVKPDEVAEDWHETDIKRQAEGIAGTEILIDAGMAETQLFRAQTSGEILVYNPKGKLIFQGGITVARGHEGDNRNREALVNALNSTDPKLVLAPIFGCPLHNAHRTDGMQ